MAEGEESKKKPTSEDECECPVCESILNVKQFKIRQNAVVKPIYKTHSEVEVVKQGELFVKKRTPARVVKKGKGSKAAAG